MTFWFIKPKEKRPAPSYIMYVNTTHWDDKLGHQGYSNIRYGSYDSLEAAREGALYVLNIDNDGPYSPENCRFSSPKEQQHNKRNTVFVEYEGIKYSQKDFFLKFSVVCYASYLTRIKRRV